MANALSNFNAIQQLTRVFFSVFSICRIMCHVITPMYANRMTLNLSVHARWPTNRKCMNGWSFKVQITQMNFIQPLTAADALRSVNYVSLVLRLKLDHSVLALLIWRGGGNRTPSDPWWESMSAWLIHLDFVRCVVVSYDMNELWRIDTGLLLRLFLSMCDLTDWSQDIKLIPFSSWILFLSKCDIGLLYLRWNISTAPYLYLHPFSLFWKMYHISFAFWKEIRREIPRSSPHSFPLIHRYVRILGHL